MIKSSKNSNYMCQFIILHARMALECKSNTLAFQCSAYVILIVRQLASKTDNCDNNRWNKIKTFFDQNHICNKMNTKTAKLKSKNIWNKFCFIINDNVNSFMGQNRLWQLNLWQLSQYKSLSWLLNTPWKLSRNTKYVMNQVTKYKTDCESWDGIPYFHVSHSFEKFVKGVTTSCHGSFSWPLNTLRENSQVTAVMEF